MLTSKDVKEIRKVDDIFYIELKPSVKTERFIEKLKRQLAKKGGGHVK